MDGGEAENRDGGGGWGEGGREDRVGEEYRPRNGTRGTTLRLLNRARTRALLFLFSFFFIFIFIRSTSSFLFYIYALFVPFLDLLHHA